MHRRCGSGALLTPQNCALILIDHQPFQFTGLNSHDPQTIVNNVVGLAKSAKIWEIPTCLVFVGGRVKKWNGDLVGCDVDRLRDRVHESRDRLAAQAGIAIDVLA